MKYTHLTRDERYQIAILMKSGHTQREIAKLMSRSPSTISRELQRNRGQRGYRPKQAHALSETRWQSSQNGPRIPEETWVVVVTNNEKDFAKYPGVKLENWLVATDASNH